MAEFDDACESYGKFEVVKILDCAAMFNGKTRYLIKWRGFQDTHTWEYEEDLNCPELLEKYRREHPEQFENPLSPAKPTNKQEMTAAPTKTEAVMATNEKIKKVKKSKIAHKKKEDNSKENSTSTSKETSKSKEITKPKGKGGRPRKNKTKN